MTAQRQFSGQSTWRGTQKESRGIPELGRRNWDFGEEQSVQDGALKRPKPDRKLWNLLRTLLKYLLRTRSRTRLSDFTFTFHVHALEKEMATHSSVLAWRIPGTGEPGGLLSMGLHRVGHDWSDLAVAAVVILLLIFWGITIPFSIVAGFPFPLRVPQVSNFSASSSILIW